MRDPLLCFSLAAQAEKRFALEIEQLLLAHRCRVGAVSTRQDPRQLAADHRVVIADAAGAPRQMNAELECRQQTLAADSYR